MDWLVSTAAMYGRALTKGASLAWRNWPMVGALFVYTALLAVAGGVASLAGPLGGMGHALVTALCFGSFLASVETIVRTGRVTLADFRASFGPYFGDVLGFMFAMWILSLIVLQVAFLAQGRAIAAFASLLMWVFFNAVPELIYLGHHSTLDLLRESYDFVANNWIEWFPLNVALLAGAVLLWFLPAGTLAWTLARVVALGLYLYFAMVVRGLLFLELSDGSRRSRIFRHRAGGAPS